MLTHESLPTWCWLLIGQFWPDLTQLPLTSLCHWKAESCAITKLFPRNKCKLTNWGQVAHMVSEFGQHWFRYGLMPDRTKPLPEPMLTSHQWSLVAVTWRQFRRKFSRYLSFISASKLLTHWGLVTSYGDRSGSTLAQVMACCLTAPSHYLNQCWLIISEVQWHSLY